MTDARTESAPPATPTNIVAFAAQGYEQYQQQMIQAMQSDAQRLTWYVAVCGYVVMNAGSHWETLLGRPLTEGDLYWLSLPWVASAVFGLSAMTIANRWRAVEQSYLYALTSAFNVLKLSATTLDEAFNGVAGIISPTKPHTPQTKMLVDFRDDATWWHKVFVLSERLTLITLAFSFVWALWGPFRLR